MPNVFHIISRLVFLKTSDFRDGIKNNHITVYTKSIFEKIFLKELRLKEVKYFLPEFAYSIFMKLKSLWKYHRKTSDSAFHNLCIAKPHNEGRTKYILRLKTKATY